MLDRTGRRLGHVREVVFDDGELAGVVMKPGGFFKHDVFVPVRFLERSDDLALFVDLTPADLERLAETTGDAHRGPVGPGSGDREDPN